VDWTESGFNVKVWTGLDWTESGFNVKVWTGLWVALIWRCGLY